MTVTGKVRKVEMREVSVVELGLQAAAADQERLRPGPAARPAPGRSARRSSGPPGQRPRTSPAAERAQPGQDDEAGGQGRRAGRPGVPVAAGRGEGAPLPAAGRAPRGRQPGDRRHRPPGPPAPGRRWTAAPRASSPATSSTLSPVRCQASAVRAGWVSDRAAHPRTTSTTTSTSSATTSTRHQPGHPAGRRARPAAAGPRRSPPRCARTGDDRPARCPARPAAGRRRRSGRRRGSRGRARTGVIATPPAISASAGPQPGEQGALVGQAEPVVGVPGRARAAAAGDDTAASVGGRRGTAGLVAPSRPTNLAACVTEPPRHPAGGRDLRATD